ncbi:hypothetical protein PY546_00095 [Providencia stuartii]|nr:hypothetical protein [Providencia stuartii]
MVFGVMVEKTSSRLVGERQLPEASGITTKDHLGGKYGNNNFQRELKNSQTQKARRVFGSKDSYEKSLSGRNLGFDIWS